jgi:nucleotide-binding universal stress UspA family protein
MAGEQSSTSLFKKLRAEATPYKKITPMKRHLLLTISKDYTAQYSISFVESFFKNKDDLLIDLLYIAPNPRKNLALDSESGQNVSEAEHLAATYKRQGTEALNNAQNILQKYGFSPEQIRKDLYFKQFSTVQDIIYYSHKGSYDALLLGRRGISFLEELLEDSVSKQVLNEKIDFPLWICRKPEKNRQNILLCADGSPESLRVADHVGFIMQNQTEHKITIFHIQNNSSYNATEIIKKTKEQIINNNFPQHLIEEKVAQGKNIGQTIFNHALNNNYAVIAMGRTGEHQSGISKFFMGSTSSYIFKNLDKVSLWVCK